MSNTQSQPIIPFYDMMRADEQSLLQPLRLYEWRFSNDNLAKARTRSSQLNRKSNAQPKQPLLTTDQRG